MESFIDFILAPENAGGVSVHSAAFSTHGEKSAFTDQTERKNDFEAD
ncbi:MAG: hypothetical protein ACTTKL_09500 [Treponema sp.]